MPNQLKLWLSLSLSKSDMSGSMMLIVPCFLHLQIQESIQLVARNVLAHIPATNITAIAVGSEVLTTLPNAAPVLVSALKFIHSALVAANLDSQIKVSTPHSSSILLDSFPPSQAFFNRSWEPCDPIGLCTLPSSPPNRKLWMLIRSCTILMSLMLLLMQRFFAMSYLNFTNIPLVVLESGWPSKGDSSEPDATIDNANTYNSNLIRHVLNNTGTPKHPGIAVSTYIYELYNEDLRPGLVSEKNWGLFDANGMPVYILHLTGSGTVLANDTTNQTYCVARDGADPKMLQAALDWACGPGKVDCSPLLQGQPCSEPDNVVAHATYAFDAYYHQMAMGQGTCYFNGVATITTTDPSHGSCKFPGSAGRNNTFINGTSLAPSSNSTSSGSQSQYFYSSGALMSCMIIGILVWSAVLFMPSFVPSRKVRGSEIDLRQVVVTGLPDSVQTNQRDYMGFIVVTILLGQLDSHQCFILSSGLQCLS
ncbi:Glucan endo-1,3-beta-glucosidase 3 [Vitis vinifera]|uniref:glucan endo-1,3-beta-D-glucosidase n=1 Tax=Vitis vinifera TaxID=29760 RepID=A0A438EL97_VITVI|nr:Glucan endo-1,3-beta-glucosidase 3 [Vitis vinifera]